MVATQLRAELRRFTGLRLFGTDEASIAAELAPLALTVMAFALLFGSTLVSLATDWWVLPEAGHGLLLAPVALWFAWRSGISQEARPNVFFGSVILLLAIALRCAGGLAAELFTMRFSMIMALVGVTVYHFGVRQVLVWWLPFILLGLSVPLPELVTQALALPLQFRASQMGAALLSMRDVPVRLTGNVIRLPGRELFVTEACSGLRSLTALLSLAVLMGAVAFRSVSLRVLLVLIAIPVAVIVNGIRVFMTGFLVYFVDPAFGAGFMHLTEGWLLFLVSLSALGLVTWLGTLIEQVLSRDRRVVAVADVDADFVEDAAHA